ncbi:MAG TPA: NAD-dependent epimerase/dehydratase family protein [Bradyrhizobium sp.]|nr:NAD-dependent epimerase/dehydratase family protein [Bradyrhizobium sp.]
MTRILVTGGSGFIGQHLVSELVARGHHVRVLDVRLPTRPMAAVDYVQGSVLDRSRVQETVTDVDEVYHLAAHPGMWKRDRAEFHAINFQGTENVLTAARKRGIGRFLHCSTESILFRSTKPGGTPAEDSRLSVEEMPGPYTRSKMLADQLALDAAASGFPLIVGCPTMPIGTHDHNTTPPTQMLRYFLGGGPLRFYLDFIVNLVDVRDVAHGLILAMEKGRLGNRYVLGGDSVPLGHVLSMMAAISGRRKLFIPIPGRIAECVASVIEFNANHVTRRTPAATVEGVRIARRASALSIEKAKRELGYAPRPVEPVLRETIARMMGASVSKVLKHA